MRSAWISVWLGLVLLVATTQVAAGTGVASGPHYRLYLDADRSVNLPSAEAIRMGVETALAMAGSPPGAPRFEVVPRDHRANVKRSLLTMRAFLEDEAALAVIGGIHSPPYLRNNDFINDNGVLMLLPWSAAGPITRPARQPNWIFRLSVDDSKAGAFMVSDALDRRGCRTPYLLLLDSGWGRFNGQQMVAALAARGVEHAGEDYYKRGIDAYTARSTARRIAGQEVDCVLFIGTVLESRLFFEAIAELAPGVRVSSHWGIAGGRFPSTVSHARREAIGLQFLHTCFPFDPAARGAFEAEVAATARALFPEAFDRFETLPAAIGFVHAFDLTRLMLAAMAEVEPGADIAETRARLRAALETVAGPVQGLMRRWVRPFGAYAPDRPDAHEALGAGDLCMVRYGPEGEIQSVPGGSRTER